MADYDVVVVGGGLAGLTAGLFAARCGRRTLVLEPTVPGGHLVNVDKVEDFPGFLEGVAGYDLCPTVQEQAANQGAEFRLAEALGLERLDRDWLVTTTEGEYRAQAVIVAVGSRPRELGVPGESRLRGKGVSQCATCDGPLFRGRRVGVVGGGDSALQEALTLASYASEVIVLHRREELRAQEAYQRRVQDDARISLRTNAIVEEILGDEAVAGIRVREAVSGAEERIELWGVFVYVGLEPNTAFLKGKLRLDETGHIPTDIWMRTELPGVFAAGDIRGDSAAQAITCAGDGATAAIAAHGYLQDRSWPSV